MPAPKTMARNVDYALERGKREKELFERMTEINETAKAEKRDLTQDEQSAFAESLAEYRRLQEEAGRDEALAEVRASVADESGMPGNPAVETRSKDLDRVGVSREIGHAARQLLRSKGVGAVQERDVLMDQGASGGYLVGTEMMRTIMSVNPERQIIRPRAFVIPAGEQPNATFEIPYFDQSSSVSGGVAFKHRKESADMSESDVDFGLLKLEAKEQSTFIQIGKKTAVNGDPLGLGTFLATFFMREKLATEDYLFLQGTGNNEPVGMLNASCKMSVTRNTSSQIKFVDITSMIVRLMDRNGALFISNNLALAELVAIADANGNNLVYQPGNIQSGTPDSLFGVPLVFTTNTPSLGSEGDLMLVNPSYYVIKDGRDWELTMYDVQPKKQLLDYVGLWDVDGAPWLRNAVAFKDGNSYSPIVVLK